MPDANHHLPPHGSVPLLDALRVYLPKMWEAYDSAEDLRANPPFPPESERSEADRKAAWKDEFAIVKMLDKTATALWDRMIEALYAKLQSGDLVAYAQDEIPFGPWRPIFATTWHFIKFKGIAKGLAEIDGRTIYNIHILAPADGAHMPTGAPGAPTKGMHLIVDQFEQRVTVKEFLPTLSAEAGYLHNWYKQTHPGRACPGHKSIENAIRAGHRKARLGLTAT